MIKINREKSYSLAKLLSDIRAIYQACSVKMAGYIGQVLFCLFMDRERANVHELAKKEQRQYPAILTEQAWSIKDLSMAFGEIFLAGHGG